MITQNVLVMKKSPKNYINKMQTSLFLSPFGKY